MIKRFGVKTSFVEQEKLMNKYFNIAFWGLLIVACILSIMIQEKSSNRISSMEQKINSMQIMLQEMSDE